MAIGNLNSRKGGGHHQEHWLVCLYHLPLGLLETCDQITSREWVSDWGVVHWRRLAAVRFQDPSRPWLRTVQTASQAATLH